MLGVGREEGESGNDGDAGRGPHAHGERDDEEMQGVGLTLWSDDRYRRRPGDLGNCGILLFNRNKN